MQPIDIEIDVIGSDAKDCVKTKQINQKTCHDTQGRRAIAMQREARQSQRDQDKERAHLESVIASFEAYLPYSLAANNVRRRSYNALSKRQRGILNRLGSELPGPSSASTGVKSEITSAESLGPRNGSSSVNANGNLWGTRGFKARLYEMDDRVCRNADFLEQIVTEGRTLMGVEEQSAAEVSPGQRNSQDSGIDATTLAHHPTRTDDAGLTATSQPISTSTSDHDHNRRQRPASANQDVDKVKSTLKQFVRDWSDRGAPERKAAYGPILDALERLFPHETLPRRHQVRLLFPGCGLGRLPWEAAMRGFSSQGNEFSLFMLLASHFVLNKTKSPLEHAIYPWVGSMSNWRDSNDLLEEVRVPDVDPNALLQSWTNGGEEHADDDASPAFSASPDFSMVAGDFLEAYSDPAQNHRGAWSAVCTCFFLDTARNVLDYLEVINHLLPIGGYWINLGPLLWHFEGSGPGSSGQQDADGVDGADERAMAGSIELTLQEILDLVVEMGFHIDERKTMDRQSYTGNRANMLSYEYECEFWVARKVRDLR